MLGQERLPVSVWLVAITTMGLMLSLGCGGGGGGDDDGNTGDTSGSSSSGGSGTSNGTTVTLSGAVNVTTADAARAGLSLPPTASVNLGGKHATKGLKSVGDAALANGTVALYKIEADGTETAVDIGTVTTDASGNYSIPNIPIASTGSGSVDDFYYEVRVSAGSLTIVAPTAPTKDTTVNVSPETHLAAAMLTDVESVAGSVLPREEIIENVRNVTVDEIANELAESFDLPSLVDNEANVTIAATAIGSDNRDAEKALRTFEAEKEALVLQSGDATTADAAAYLERVSREGCDFNENFNLPSSARGLLAAAFVEGTTVTTTQVVAAYNNNNGSDPDVTAANAVSDFDSLLTTIDTAMTGSTDLDTDDQLGLYVKRDLSAAAFDETTALQIDQATALTQGLFPQDCQPGGFDMIGFASDLTGSSQFSAPTIVDRQIFHDMGFNCGGGSIGHLRATVQVYAAGGATVNGVSITKNGTIKALTMANQNGAFSRWQSSSSENDPDFYCMDLPSDITYTITVDLDGADDLTETVTAQHREVPEAGLSFVNDDGTLTPLANDQSIFPTAAKRPIFKWVPAPGTPEASVIADAPAGSQFKFTFELSHVLSNAWLDANVPENQDADPNNDVNEGPLTHASCPMGGSGQKLMDRNYFIADSDCDIDGCLAALQASPTLALATANGEVSINTSTITRDAIHCRTNIQTFLVDTHDRMLGQAAGNFRSYCYDANGDGDCGD